jgi:hypothetical protein
MVSTEGRDIVGPWYSACAHIIERAIVRSIMQNEGHIKTLAHRTKGNIIGRRVASMDNDTRKGREATNPLANQGPGANSGAASVAVKRMPALLLCPAGLSKTQQRILHKLYQSELA